MFEWHHWLNGHGFGWTLAFGGGQGVLLCCGSWGDKESDMTERLNWSELMGLDDMILVFWMLSFKPTFSLSSFTSRNSSLSPGAYSNSRPLSWWCHPTISSSVIPFSSCLQYFPASGLFQWISYSPSGGQSTGASASTSVPPMNIQDWFPLELTGLISLQFKGLSKVFFSTTIWKH